MAEKRLAVVTGAAQGIGRAIVLELLKQGREVAGLDLNAEQLTELEAVAKEAGYKYPVFLTSGVLGLIERAVDNQKYCNDFTGVLWDILYMSRVAGQSVNERTTKFQVIITGTGKRKHHTMYIECGPMDIDDPAPVLTIMLPEDL